jgi:hypothetical protein
LVLLVLSIGVRRRLIRVVTRRVSLA